LEDRNGGKGECIPDILNSCGRPNILVVTLSKYGMHEVSRSFRSRRKDQFETKCNDLQRNTCRQSVLLDGTEGSLFPWIQLIDAGSVLTQNR
jgi:hypothetical protein